MTKNQFPTTSIAEMQIEEDESGQIIEKRLAFNWKGLDYIFVFSPSQDCQEEGPTLTYVGNSKRGRLPPSEYADDEAWLIASSKMNLSLTRN